MRSKYDPKYCEEIIELGKKGYTTYSFAAHCNVHRTSLYDWAGQHPEFKEALEAATRHSRAFLEQQVADNLGNKNFQVKGAEFLARYMHQVHEGRLLKSGITKDMSYTEKTQQIIMAGEQGKLSVDEVMKLCQATANAAKVEENEKLKDELFRIKVLLKEQGIEL